MDFTRFEINEDSEKNEDEMFYSFTGEIQKANSNTNTDLFAHILLLNGEFNQSDKKSSQRCLSSNKDSQVDNYCRKEDDRKDKDKDRDRQLLKKSSSQQMEQKREVKKQEKNNNNVSLLQSFLKPIKDTIMPSLNRMGILGSEKVGPKDNQQNNKTTTIDLGIGDEKSKQKAKGEQKQKIANQQQEQMNIVSVEISPNVDKVGQEKGQDVKQILVVEKMGKADDNFHQSKSANNKKYRIKSPDQVFDELESEKINNQGKNQKTAPQTVKNNINTFKAKLEEDPNFTTDKNKETPNINNYRTVGALSIVATSLKPVTTKNQTIISACLVRLPRSSNNHSDQNYYKKYKYQLAENELIINNNFYVSYADITKIKVIRNQYNRPQIKVTYNGILSEGGMGIAYRQTHKSELQNANEGDDDQNISSTEMVFYLCETYQAIFMIFSWIIISKTKKASGINLIDVIMCVNRVCQPDSFDYAISGMIYKRSKYIKNWDKRYCQIENFQLKTYRESQKQVQNMLKEQNLNSNAKRTSATFQISSLRQLWTRFQIIDHKYVVMKMFQRQKLDKIQIAIPLTNYCDCLSINNWMIGLFSLLKSES